MRAMPFLILISIIFLVGSVFFYLGGGNFNFSSDWTMFSIFPFSIDLVLIAIKVDNWRKHFVENL